MGGNIRKSGVGHGGNGIAVLLRQQTGEDSGGLRAGHAAAGAEGPVCVAQDIGAVTLSFLDFRNGQLAVLIRLALGRLAQVTLNNDVFILLRIFLVVGDGNRHTVVFIQIRAIRQFDRNIAGLTDGNPRRLRLGREKFGEGHYHCGGVANATINEALKPFYSFFAASLAALRRPSPYFHAPIPPHGACCGQTYNQKFPVSNCQSQP